MMAIASSSSSSIEEDPPPTKQNVEPPRSALRSPRQIFILSLFPFGEAIAWTTTFPYIYAMVLSLSPSPSSTTSPSSNPSTYAGILVGAFTLGESLGSIIWAPISDNIGRKPTLLLGNMGAMIFALGFGFSRSLWWAVTMRVLAGMANPNIAVVQTFIGELCCREEQAKGFSDVAFYRTIGTILGPPLGGYLAEPVSKYPFIFHPNSIWETYPYLLPNLLAALTLFTSALLALFYLDEVHPGLKQGPDLLTRFRNFLRGWGWGKKKGVYEAINTDEAMLENLTGNEDAKPPEEQKINRKLAFTPQVRLQILSFTLLGYLKLSILAIEPIFLGTPSSPHSPSPLSPSKIIMHTIFGYPSGFSLSTTSTSNILLSQAIAAILSQWFLVTPLIKRFGALRSYKLVLLTFLGVFVVCPVATALPRWLGLVVLIPVLLIYSLINTLGSTAQSILITNTTPHPKYLATINGAAVTVGCLARTAGPAVSGWLFRVGLEIGYVGVCFWSLVAVCVGGLGVGVWLRDFP